MDAKHSAIVLMASVLPQENLVEMLENAIEEWKEAKLLGKSEEEIEDQFRRLGFNCHLILLNIISNNSVDGAVNTMEKMERLQRATKMFEPDTN